MTSLNEWLEEYANDELVKNGLSEDYWRRRIAYNEGKYDTAINMLRDNEPIDKIVKYTGLSIEEIKDLEETNGN